jgi:hypothetical protein
MPDFKVLKRQGFIDKTGAIALRLPVEAYAGAFWQGLAIALDKRYRFGAIDKTSKFVVRPQFDDVGSFSEGLATARLPSLDGLSYISYGYINQKGEFAIPPV